jgi:hypothetical protein
MTSVCTIALFQKYIFITISQFKQLVLGVGIREKTFQILEI